MTESKEQYSCKLCRNYGKTNYCRVCHCVESPSGKITKPTLWEAAEKRKDDRVLLMYFRFAISNWLSKGKPIPVNLIKKYNKLVQKLFKE